MKIYYILFLSFLLISCSSEEEKDKVESYKTIFNIEEGSKFILSTRFHEPIDTVIYSNNAALEGITEYNITQNQYTHRLYGLKINFSNEVTLSSMFMKVSNNTIDWLGSESTEANFFGKNLKYENFNDEYTIDFIDGKPFLFARGNNNYSITIQGRIHIQVVGKQ